MTKLSGWLKKYFIPHENNDHKPHFLRIKTVIIILSIVLAVETIFLVPIVEFLSKTNFFASILPYVVVDGTNDQRIQNNIKPLAVNPLLEKAAQLKADDMAEKGYFSHDTPEGFAPWHWLQIAGYDFSYAGENLAVNFFDSKDVVEAWMNSAKHKENILNSNFTEIGIAAVKGMYKGKEAVFVVQFFGTPALAKAGSETINGVAALNSATSSTAKKESAEIKISNPNYEESFVAVDKDGNVLPASVSAENLPAVKYSSLISRIVTTPRNVFNYLYVVILTIILLSLALKIFIKIKIQHPPLIVNGVILLIIVSSVLVLNNFISFHYGRIFGG